VLGEGAFFPSEVDLAPNAEAPLVFVGWGLQVPERDYDDLAGLDLKGKIAVTMPGRPAEIEQALYVRRSANALRWKQFREAGLVGWIEIAATQTPAAWLNLRNALAGPTKALAGHDSNDGNGMVHLLVNPAHADKLLAGSGHTYAELHALGLAFKRLPRFPLQPGVRVRTRMLKEPLDSANLIAKLAGSDPTLRNEYVVLSAHLDHLGIRQEVNGDRIYNGAVDNASGVGALLDIAAVLKREGARPRRSILFTFFTSEEGGKLGSTYFAAHPTINRESIVADINIDGIHALVPLTTVLALGGDESDLGDAARRIGESLGIAMDESMDRDTRSMRFANSSDQASFASAGIPAVKLNVGFPGELSAVMQRWQRERYHTPFDDPQQPINLGAIAAYEEFARALLLDVANNPRRPEWKPSSFYKRDATGSTGKY
jgi:Zn-dependent M28 family amino/carboxypeptidase